MLHIIPMWERSQSAGGIDTALIFVSRLYPRNPNFQKNLPLNGRFTPDGHFFQSLSGRGRGVGKTIDGSVWIFSVRFGIGSFGISGPKYRIIRFGSVCVEKIQTVRFGILGNYTDRIIRFGLAIPNPSIL